MTRTDKPNILYLLNDHQAYYRHGWDTGPEVRRPNFDHLASGGINFTRAYSSHPLCGPARRTMLNGLLTHHHREIRNDRNHPFDEQTYLDALAAAGYRNFYYGKWHAGPGTAKDHHCEGFCYESYNNPYTKGEYLDYLARRGLDAPTINVEHSMWPQQIPTGSGYRQDGGWCNEHASGIFNGSKEAHEAFFLANTACEKLRELAASGDSAPWHLRVDFWGPHQPYFPTREYAELYRPESIPEYGSFRDSLDGKPECYRVEFNPAIGTDGKLLQPSPLPWSTWQEILSRCYGQITMMDEAAGRILDTLDELGLADNTLVIWTTDHGDAVACHGGHFDKAGYMPEEMIRIPLVARFPGRIQPAQTSEALVSLIDIAPTFLEAAETAFDHQPDGRSLLSMHDWRDDLMIETYGHCGNHFARAVVTGRYKYVWNHGQREELYDLQRDPYELTNLAADESCANVLVEMQSRLAAWRERTGDTETAFPDP